MEAGSLTVREHEALKKLVAEYSGAGARVPALRARVVKASNADGGKAGLLHPRYSVDVQPLLRDGEDDSAWPVLPAVELPVLWGGSGRGVFALPAVGTIVRLGSYYNDPSQPYVDAVLAYGGQVPAHEQGEMLIAQSDSVRVVIKADGKVRVEGNGVELVGGAGLLSGLVRQCDTCAFTGSPHPAGSADVRAT